MIELKTFNNDEKKENEFANSIIRKLKAKAKSISSLDPKHKDRLKYSISKTEYDYTLFKEVRKLPETHQVSVKRIIDRKLIKV